MNSSIEIVEAAQLAQKLIDRTTEGKISWEPVEATLQHAMSHEPALHANQFAARLEPNFRATVGKSGSDVLRFSLVENPQVNTMVAAVLNSYREKVVIDVTVEEAPPYGHSSSQEKHLATLLVDLYGLARRSALKIEESVEKALSYLDRIAG